MFKTIASNINKIMETAEDISNRVAGSMNKVGNLTWGKHPQDNPLKDSDEIKESLNDISSEVTHAGDGHFASVLLVSPNDSSSPIAAKIGADEHYHTFVEEVAMKFNSPEDGFPNKHLPRIYSTTSFDSPIGEGHVYCMEELVPLDGDKFKELPEDVQEEMNQQFDHIEIIADKALGDPEWEPTPERLVEALDSLSLDTTNTLAEIIESQQKNDVLLDMGKSNVMARISEDKQSADLVMMDPFWNGVDEAPGFSEEPDAEQEEEMSR
jgi:hypothetical protein